MFVRILYAVQTGTKTNMVIQNADKLLLNTQKIILNTDTRQAQYRQQRPTKHHHHHYYK